LKKTLILIGKFLFFLGIGIFFIWIFMRNLTPVEKKEIFHSFKQANYWWILLSMGLGILSHTSRTLRWKMLLKPMGYNPRFINVFFAVFIGYFANLALPRCNAPIVGTKPTDTPRAFIAFKKLHVSNIFSKTFILTDY